MCGQQHLALTSPKVPPNSRPDGCKEAHCPPRTGWLLFPGEDLEGAETNHDAAPEGSAASNRGLVMSVDEAKQLLEDGEGLPVDQEVLGLLRDNLQLVHDWEGRLADVSSEQACLVLCPAQPRSKPSSRAELASYVMFPGYRGGWAAPQDPDTAGGGGAANAAATRKPAGSGRCAGQGIWVASQGGTAVQGRCAAATSRVPPRTGTGMSRRQGCVAVQARSPSSRRCRRSRCPAESCWCKLRPASALRRQWSWQRGGASPAGS